MKWCPQCGTRKRTSSFNKHRNRPDGLSSMCRECHKKCRGRKLDRILICQACGKKFIAKDHKQISCSLSCGSIVAARDRDFNGPRNPNWRGGITVSSKGYVYLLVPGHHRSNSKGYVKRADVVLEKKLGRLLEKGEIAHHINENKDDDDPENLTPMVIRDHGLHHGQKRRKERPSRKARKIIPWPPTEELRAMVAQSSLRHVARELGCSHVAIFHRLQK